MTDLELDERVTALEENGNYDHVNSKGVDSFISFKLDTGRAWLIRSLSSARISFEIS